MLHEALRTLRVFHDMTQKELSERLGISKSHLSEIEGGKKTPVLSLLDKYSAVFEIPVSSILFFSENINNDKTAEKVRVAVSSKILSLLSFIAERSGKMYAE
ncbi:DNA-binding transcriptional regulator, XRE-family HTH domain [Methylomagnum ishizawai]|uniref:DNA-binding transcriptional regulator, XRE-family HTH domain n=1 Tax=Methylomagnum ishizawai TaxID=1760988 RepID=A0A1Y6D4Q1_9GAMM|nr:helix-turn-helix transcriptional regulator [Methylomagnum ishizawai]SMF97927.1 DNA-binding transcriptional regulator, XRE-family HTH domain [Methylomagnum ishizawai]SMF97939.1 DNA-binding transcriptional regulator, XRE-family HTH domain [Methylomagnum ishizawai]